MHKLPCTPSSGNYISSLSNCALPSPCQPENLPSTDDLGDVCQLNEDKKRCETHNTCLTEFRLRIKTWTRCSDGLYRNVFRVQKTFRCSESTEAARQKTRVPTMGERLTNFYSSPRLGQKRRRTWGITYSTPTHYVFWRETKQRIQEFVY